MSLIQIYQTKLGQIREQPNIQKVKIYQKVKSQLRQDRGATNRGQIGVKLM